MTNPYYVGSAYVIRVLFSKKKQKTCENDMIMALD